MKSYQQIRCQRCRAVNPLGEELCGQCGTRLMLVVEPSALRFEEDALAAGQHEGLIVERLSLLENNLTRVIGHLERSTDLLSQQAQIVSREHMLLEALIAMLSEAGVIDVAALQRLWEMNCARAAEGARQTKLRDEMRAAIVQAYTGTAAREFARLVEEGFAALEEEAGDDGWRLLERAAALAPENALLNALLGRQFFQTGKVHLARSYLERAHKAVPTNAGVCLMLALVRGDEGDAAGALALLAEAERLGGASTFGVAYARGRLWAHTGRWREALAEFKRALAAHVAPEAHYVVALAAYQLNFGKLAVQHVNKALALDKHYAEALNLLGLILRRSSDAAGARAAFRQARAINASVQQTDNGAGRGARFTDESLLRSFFGAGLERERLLSGGDARLATLLRKAAQGE
jgi:tetratricopeptide (TPR) repeat protein